MIFIKYLKYLLWVGWVLSLSCTLQSYISLSDNIEYVGTDKSWKYEFSQIAFWGFLSMFLISSISIIYYYLRGKKFLDKSLS
ncbi:hypothetical protein BST92_07910 [Nonlabens arenilitoris]|uniref:Lipoprotein n=1 Tax=Nonlabens arenilitoris TaxID=1217969 RepID=A0A2S7UA96_9FLAO|nr:hypothetical protein BST92_07910 [Nonlabens arenilitoris]